MGCQEKLKRNCAVFAIGLFAIASQAVILREFICSFESDDIAVGFFFGAWFFWVAAASTAVLVFPGSAARLSAKTHLVALLYVPAFMAQYWIMLNIRTLAGVEAYEIFSIWKLLGWALAATAPVSLVTGLVFPLACRWSAGNSPHPVAATFIYESIGSFVGGAGTALLLYVGMTMEHLSILLCLVLITACSFSLERRGTLLLLGLGAALAVGALAFHAGDWARMKKWNRLLPSDAYRGYFVTPQSEYLFGVYNGQWSFIREGGAGESVPDSESALKIISVNLCQKPDARRILVIGAGLNLCRELLRFPQFHDVSWTHYDGDYIRQVNSFLPDELRISDPRFRPVPGSDAREFLRRNPNFFDIIIVNMPDATSSVVNRYFTVEFYKAAAESLVKGGVLGTRVSGAENVMGPELALAGASVKNSLERVFKNLVLVPGDSSWFVASNSNELSGEPDVVVGRMAAVQGVDSVFPVESLRSFYLPDRAESALRAYASAAHGASSIENRDSKPLAFLYALLLSSRQSGMDITKLCLKTMSLGRGFLLLPVLILLFLSLLLALCDRTGGMGDPGAARVVFCAGFISIGTVVALMYLFQTLLGTLYLHAGLVSALFMAGLAIGGAVAVFRPLWGKLTPANHLSVGIAAHIALLYALSRQDAESWGLAGFAAAFLLSGVCCGIYFPIAAQILKELREDELRSGGALESADHVGACAGAVATGVLLVPFYGMSGALFFFMLLLAVNIPLCAARSFLGSSTHETSPWTLTLRHGAYILFAIGAFMALYGTMLFGAHTSLYIMLTAIPPFTFLAFRRSLAARMLFFGVGLLVAVVSVAGFNSAFNKEESVAVPKKPPFFESPMAPLAAVGAEVGNTTDAEAKATGTPRDVDMPKLLKMIKAGQLSDKEAEFYIKLDKK